MSEIILLVGHGSRDPAGNREIETFADRWRRRHPDWRIEVCFIEFAEVLVADGLTRAARLARRVVVVPLILNAAGHVKMEIPEHIEAARARHPATEFIYAPHLDACEPILSILKRRLQAAMRELDMPDPRTTGVILLGRGSSDRMANGEVAKMARWLQEAGEHELVDIAFTGITHPRLERVVQHQVQLGMMQLVVLPYYLFTGMLMQRIARQVEHLRRQYPHIRLACGSHFGFEEEIFALLAQRVSEAGCETTRMPCDGCKYRQIAHGHAHHHHGPGMP
jgi:sirohydrochlorin cobaltochelatase